MTTALGFKLYPMREELQKIGSMSGFGIGTRRPSGSAASTASYGSSSNQPALSTLEDSGNVNNRGLLQQSSSQRDCFAVPQQQSGAERDSSTLVNTGSATGGTAASLQRMTSNGSLNKQQQTSSLSNNNNESCDAATAGSDAAGERIIEEKRKRANGDGFSIHRYTLGRLLGKGGFAKVYLCTAMDTGKNYAVKVVPKANLVKARARQKVR